MFGEKLPTQKFQITATTCGDKLFRNVSMLAKNLNSLEQQCISLGVLFSDDVDRRKIFVCVFCLNDIIFNLRANLLAFHMPRSICWTRFTNCLQARSVFLSDDTRHLPASAPLLHTLSPPDHCDVLPLLVPFISQTARMLAKGSSASPTIAVNRSAKRAVARPISLVVVADRTGAAVLSKRVEEVGPMTPCVS